MSISYKISTNLKSIFDEILSWNLENLKNKKKFYKTKKISIKISSILLFQKNLEPLFFEEFRAQLNRVLWVHLKLIIQNESKIIWICIKKKKVTCLLRLSKKFKEKNKKGDFLILSKKIKAKSFTLQELGICFILDIFPHQNEYLIQTNYKILEFIKKSPKSNFFLRQIFIPKPFLKEFFSLKSIKKIPNKIQTILFCIKKKKVEKYFLTQKYFEKIHFKIHFNPSQIKSIFSVLKNKITLIQGPPGTGKTRTILGIISLIILYVEILQNKNKSSKSMNMRRLYKPKKFKKKNIFIQKRSHIDYKNDFLNTNYIYNKKLLEFRKSKNFFKKKDKRIIICAFSNAATDENTSRIAFGLPVQKFLIKNRPYSMIRVGPNYKIFLDHMTLDNYAIVWASENDSRNTLWNLSKILEKSRIKILKNSFIIYTTLACASYSFFEKIKKKETIIIDEAAQAIEILTLSPIRKSCKKLILVGDIQQLPATVFSQTSLNYNYDRSLFKRLQLNKFPIWFLETQYRMHPQISSFIARKFYKNGLKDSENVALLKNFQFLRGFGPFVFFDVCEGNEQNHLKQKNSWCNLDEIRLISMLIRGIICLFSNLSWRSIGIITSYQGQIGEIQDFRIIKKSDFKGQINSVDGFQGREKEVIFFSSVRAKIERGVGFLSDCRRINVAFTRAKSCFWGIGNLSTLRKDSNWAEAVLDARKRGRFFTIHKPFERSNRRIVFWGPSDEENFCYDGEHVVSSNYLLLNYIKIFFI